MVAQLAAQGGLGHRRPLSLLPRPTVFPVTISKEIWTQVGNAKNRVFCDYCDFDHFVKKGHALQCNTIRDGLLQKKMFSFGHCPKKGGGDPCPNFFYSFFHHVVNIMLCDIFWSFLTPKSSKVPKL